jgi:peptidoglycan hydrolase-like protein with peptidoglycan-binding domain
MQTAILTRSRFGAYDPEVWVVQTYLKELGFDPGTIDGLWGTRTADAALAFRAWQGFEPAAGLDKAAIVTEDFLTYLDREVASAGFDINITAPASAPGGSGTGPVVTKPLVTGASPSLPSPLDEASGGGGFPLLALAAIGLGAVIVFGGKKRR